MWPYTSVTLPCPLFVCLSYLLLQHVRCRHLPQLSTQRQVQTCNSPQLRRLENKAQHGVELVTRATCWVSLFSHSLIHPGSSCSQCLLLSRLRSSWPRGLSRPRGALDRHLRSREGQNSHHRPGRLPQRPVCAFHSQLPLRQLYGRPIHHLHP
jgi:hypothetical protein